MMHAFTLSDSTSTCNDVITRGCDGAGELGIDTQVSKEEPEEEKKEEPGSGADGAAGSGAAANKKKKKKKKPKRASQTGQSDDWVKVDAPAGESGDAAAEGEKVCVATLLKSKQKTTKKDTSKAIAAKEAKARAAKKAEAEKKKQKKKKKVRFCSFNWRFHVACRREKFSICPNACSHFRMDDFLVASA